MDLFSLAVGFVVGAFTGASGNYLADRFTDARRRKELAKEHLTIWKEIEARFPKVIAEMREDLSTPEGKSVRAFFVLASDSFLAGSSEPSFEYYTDKHENLMAAIFMLEQHGFVTDITPGKCPMYRMHETLVDRLLAFKG